MRKWTFGAAAMVALALPAAANGQNPAAPAQVPAAGQVGTPNYDVVLEVPQLSVDSIGINVERLQAHLALNANAVNLVSLVAGVDVGIERVRLSIEGVVAEAYVYVDLDNVNRIVERVLRTLDQNPELVTRLLTTVDTTVSTLGGVANTALQPGGAVSQTVGALGQTLNNVTQPGGLLSQTVNTLGQTVQRTLDSSGNLVERTLNASGGVLSQRAVGTLLNGEGIRVVQQTTNAAGQIVRRVEDQTGAVMEYTLDQAGGVTNARVLRQGSD